jgi:hypothetical protein
MNLCTILGHKKTKEKADDKKIGSGGAGGSGLYMSMIQIRCVRCDKVFKTRPEDYRDH